MLNYVKRHIHICAFFVTLAVLIILMIFDIQNFQEKSNHEQQKKLENSIAIENVYTELSKKSQRTVTKEKKRIEKIEAVDKIDIYSTNPWRIKIPKLRIDAPITEGTSSEALRRTVGHFEQTDKWKGNVCLAGHNRGYRCNFFQEINKLQKGDIIIYCTRKQERRYKVVINTVIKETDWRYIENTEDNRITLITCEMNRKEYRRCIQAVEIKNM